MATDITIIDKSNRELTPLGIAAHPCLLIHGDKRYARRICSCKDRGSVDNFAHYLDGGASSGALENILRLHNSDDPHLGYGKRPRICLEASGKPRQRICAVSRAIQFQLSGGLLHRRTVARLGEHSSLWVDLHRAGASKVVYGNLPDYPEMLIWQQVLQSGDLFVDVGTNVGSYTIWAADLGAEVVALEPTVAERKIVDGRNTVAPEV